ncbi:MAG TPA: CoA pyrophosphatase [Acidobacteriota bacterium]|nr:CoA pyrophosphatase [Acidobacteriota bacterium]
MVSEFSSARTFKEDVQSRLQRLTPRIVKDGVAGEAAVLISLIVEGDLPKFLLTRRTEHVSTHKGQISFPGGGRHREDDTLLETAVRETQEELGIGPETLEVTGRFHDYVAVTGIRVASFVGFLQGELIFEPDPLEVAYLLKVPLRFFEESRPVVRRYHRLGRERDVYFYNYGGEEVWGLTAQIIRDFLHLINSTGQ